jgi:hypothetical protein
LWRAIEVSEAGDTKPAERPRDGAHASPDFDNKEKKTMPRFIRKWLGPIMGFLLCLAAAPAFAGEWVRGVSDREGWNAIGYRGNFNEGEFATLYYTSIGEKKFSGDSREQLYRLGMLLNDGDAAITGFTGVALVSRSSDGTFKNLLTLSQGPHRDYWGELAGSYDAGAHGGVADNWNNISAWHACFRTRPSEIDSTLSVPCDSGEGRWVYVEVRGRLKEEMRHVDDTAGLTLEEILEQAVKDTAEGNASGKREFYSPGPAIRAATNLYVGAKNGEHTSFNLTIDDAFRHALWDENFWGKK